MYVLFRKELADHLDSVRFLIVLAMALLIGGVSLYAALGGIVDATAASNVSGFVFLRLFVTGSGNINSFVWFVAMFGPIIGMILGFDAINSEKSAGTLNRLLAQPIYRDDVINGKFLAGVTVIAIIVISMVLLVAGVGLLRIGVPPSGEEVMRLIVFTLFSIVYVSFWLGLAILLSVVTRHAASSVIAVVVVWLALGLLMSLITSGLAGALYPPDGTQAMEEGRVIFQQTFSRISPTMLYSEATSTILDPSIRLTSWAPGLQIGGVVPGALPLGQSLLLVWPYLIGIIAETVAAFVISYIVFMKQEIRGA